MTRRNFLAALFLGLLLFPACGQADGYSQAGLPLTDLTIRTSSGATHIFHVEVARTAPELAQGLMFRTGMASNAGMLFVFGGEGERSFWMKNTYIPLDIIFVKSDGTIRTIHHSARKLSLQGLPSGGPVTAALELNGGTAARLGIEPGDVVYSEKYLPKKNVP